MDCTKIMATMEGKEMNFLDMFLQIYLVTIVVVIILIVIAKAKNKGKLSCLVLKPSKYYSIEKKKPDGNKLDFKNWKLQPEFGTEDIYTEEKAGWKFWRLPKQLVVIGQNCRKALKWKKRGDNELSSVWTDKEQKEYIAKLVAKARAKGQVISNAWAIIIIMLIMALFFLVFFGFNRMGIL